jgi:predicted ester cyclase
VVASESRGIVERWFSDLFGRGDLSVVNDLAADDLVVYDAKGMVVAASREQFVSWLRWYLATFTDGEWRIHDVISENDKLAVRYSGETIYRGGLLDIPTRNQRVTEMGMLIFRIEENKVRELWTALCDLEVVVSLGAKIVSSET